MMRLRLWSILALVTITTQLSSCSGGSSSTPAKTTAVSVTVQPSTLSQTVTAGQVSVIIPGGLLSTAATLTVDGGAAQSAKPAAAAEVLGSYAVSLGTSTTFDQKITLEIPYDPAKLDSTVPEGKNLWVSSWDDQKKVWQDQVVEVDTTRKRLIVQTDHLSTWAYWRLQGYTYINAANGYGPFEVYYNPTAQQPRTDSVSGYTMKDLATDVMAALTTAKQSYADAGYTVPSSQIKVIIQEDTSQMFGITGNLHLKRDSLTSLALLRHDSGHELFHVIQNQYYNVYSMGYKQWFMESTPDYVSAVLWSQMTMLPKLEATYFDESLNSSDDPHSYQNSHFMRWLVDTQNVNFKTLWDSVYARSTRGDNAFVAFQGYVAEASGKVFSTLFQNWVEYAMFDVSKPMAAVGTTSFTVPNKQTPTKITDFKTVSVPSYSAKVVNVGTSNLSGTQKQSVKISVSGLGAAAGNIVEVWQLASSDGLSANIDRTKGVLKKVLVSDSDTAILDLASNEYLYNVVINTGTATSNVTVTATAQTPTITAVSPAKGPVGTAVTVTGTGFGTTAGTVKFGFGSALTTASVSSWSDTQISTTVPAGASMDPAANVYVVTVGGASSYGYFFQVTTDAGTGGGTGTTTKFTNNGNGTITQNLSKDLVALNTKLMWQQLDDGILRTWDDAKLYCEGLSLGGYSGWMLPTLTRLAGIADTTKSPMIDTAYFTNAKAAIYWSGTVSSDGFNAAYIDFTNGSSGYITKNSYDQLVRCVRTAP